MDIEPPALLPWDDPAPPRARRRWLVPLVSVVWVAGALAVLRPHAPVDAPAAPPPPVGEALAPPTVGVDEDQAAAVTAALQPLLPTDPPDAPRATIVSRSHVGHTSELKPILIILVSRTRRGAANRRTQP